MEDRIMPNYREDLKIDEFNLDGECLKQPVLFEMYTQKLTPLYKLRDELKLEVERFAAKMDGVIRESASAEGKKITETMIQNEIIRNVQYGDLQQKYIQVCTEVKEGEVIRESFQQKKEVLKLLTELYIGQYWSTVEPKVLKQKGTENLRNKLEEKISEENKIKTSNK